MSSLATPLAQNQPGYNLEQPAQPLRPRPTVPPRPVQQLYGTPDNQQQADTASQVKVPEPAGPPSPPPPVSPAPNVSTCFISSFKFHSLNL